MRRIAVVVAAIVIAATTWQLVPGFASSVSSPSLSLGAAQTTVGRCDSDGFTVTETISGTNITGATVAGIAAACATATLSVNVNNATTNQTATGVVPAGGGSVVVTLGTAVAIAPSVQIDTSIVGP